jgi:hypothetical protein
MEKQNLDDKDVKITSLILGKFKNEYPAQGPEDLFGFIGRPMLYTRDPSFAIQATQLNHKRKRGKKSVKKDCDKNSVESDLNNVD